LTEDELAALKAATGTEDPAERQAGSETFRHDGE
jgi:hypothetical protein